MADIFSYAGIDTSVSTIAESTTPQGKTQEELLGLVRAKRDVQEQRDEALEAEMQGVTLGGYAAETMKQESMANAAWQGVQYLAEKVDPDFDPHGLIKDDMPEHWKADLRGTLNESHYHRVVEKLEGQDFYKKQGEYFGGVGTAVNLLSIVASPETILMGVGEAAAITKLALKGVGKFAFGATVGAASNTSQELAVIANNKSRDKMGAVIAAATGASLGGLFSLIPSARVDSEAILKTEDLLGKGYSRAAGVDYDMATGKIKIDNVEPMTDLQEAAVYGRMMKDPATGKYVMDVGGTPVQYPDRETALSAYKKLKDSGYWDKAPERPTVDAEAAPKAEPEVTPPPAPVVEPVPLSDVIESIGEQVGRQKAYAGFMKSIGGEGMSSTNPVIRGLHWEGVEFAAGTGGKVVANHSAGLIGSRLLHKLRSTFNVSHVNNKKAWRKTHAKGSPGPWDKHPDARFDKAVLEEVTYRKYPESRPTGHTVDPNVKKSADVYEQSETMRFEMQQDAKVKGYEGLKGDSRHIQQKWDPYMLNKVARSRPDGEAFVMSVLKKGILSSNEFDKVAKYAGKELTDEYKDKVAGFQAKAIFERFKNRPNTINEARSTYLRKKDLSKLESRMKELIDDPEELKHILRAADERDSKMLNEYMKQIGMNLNAELDGVKVLDLLDTNLGRTQDSNFRRSAGRAAWAQKGFRDQSDFLDVVESAGQWGQKHQPENPVDIPRLQKLWNLVLGENLEAAPGSPTARWSRGIRKGATLGALNQVGWVQASELGKLVGTLGVRGFMRQIPELSAMRRSMLNGKFADNVLNDIEAAGMIRLGDDHLLNHPQLMADAGGYGLSVESSNAFMKGLDTTVAKLMHGQGYINGMSMVMRMQQRMHARGFIDRMWEDMGKGLSPARVKRYADIGLSEDDLKVLSKEMNTNATTTKGWFGQDRLNNANIINYSADIREKLLLAMHKSQGQSIQKNLTGEGSWLMESTFGKFLTQFKSFPMVAMEKQTIHDLKFRDVEAFTTMMASFGFCTLAYMGKTYANSFGLEPKKRKKYLKNRLSMEAIAAGAGRWMGQLSMLPEAFEIGGAFGLDNPFQYTHTKGSAYIQANDDLNVGDISPGGSFINSAYRFATGLGHSVLTGQELTNNTLRHGVRIVPFNGAVILKNGISYATQD